jgi:hypothetical protein
VEYRYDRYFREVLGVRRVPSEETLRQRIEQLSEKIMQVVRPWNREIIAAGFADVAAHSTTKEEWSEAVTIGEQHYMIIDQRKPSADGAR